jgi:hypothetical protein
MFHCHPPFGQWAFTSDISVWRGNGTAKQAMWSLAVFQGILSLRRDAWLDARRTAATVVGRIGAEVD